MIVQLLILIALMALPIHITSALAQDAKLIEAARKDGKLIVYGTMQTDNFEPLQKIFQKKTGITVDYWRTSATKMMERALTEARRLPRMIAKDKPLTFDRELWEIT